ncbi:MAG: GtrA family protein [Pseudomonadota bacterium]
MLDTHLSRFAVVGLGNTAAGLIIIYAAKAGLGLGDVYANALGYALMIGAGFALNRRWTFMHHGEGLGAFWRYLLVLALAYLANIVTVLVASRVLQVDPYLAQAMGIVPYAATGYLGSKYFAFAQRRVPPDDGLSAPAPN